ncbi:hypothetical protein COLO4_38535 [Corchorus olitorius]|uniref:RRM domain-containing protein n=1 Tax=Corchorus olitorius TaxID=93759 RepID=A0A1R3FUB7_9ROSI|nr:hypothetical protein COLO4_38535 [Corchorus olitorius]
MRGSKVAVLSTIEIAEGGILPMETKPSLCFRWRRDRFSKFAFVRFRFDDELFRAINLGNGRRLDGRSLLVREGTICKFDMKQASFHARSRSYVTNLRGNRRVHGRGRSQVCGENGGGFDRTRKRFPARRSVPPVRHNLKQRHRISNATPIVEQANDQKQPVVDKANASNVIPESKEIMGNDDDNDEWRLKILDEEIVRESLNFVRKDKDDLENFNSIGRDNDESYDCVGNSLAIMEAEDTFEVSKALGLEFCEDRDLIISRLVGLEVTQRLGARDASQVRAQGYTIHKLEPRATRSDDREPSAENMGTKRRGWRRR